MISVLILGIVFTLISVRQIGKIKLQIWQIMLFGAIAVILFDKTPFIQNLKSINIDVMLFLFGMFIIGRAMEESGYLTHLSYSLFKRSKSDKILLLAILFGGGILSAVLMNDTIAIIGAPVMLLLAKEHNIKPKALLLALAFSITIGSAMSPIGNPQNLLIAIHGNIPNPFAAFLKYLFIPTIINLFVAYFIIRIFFKGEFGGKTIEHLRGKIHDENLAKYSRMSLRIILILISCKIFFSFIFPSFSFSLTYIAIISMLPILIFSRNRFEIVAYIDWHTLIFFAAMFVLMGSVWDSGFFQKIMREMRFDLTTIPSIMGISIILSQLVSNVPMVALYMPTLLSAGVPVKALIALAAGSTIAGNLLILGAASNIIIIQNSESRKGATISFFDFAKVGIPLTIVNVLVYYLFLWLIP